MSENIFEKFDEMMDVEGLKNDLADLENNSNREYEKPPYGDYEVKITKLELGASGEKSKVPGSPMAKVTFEILNGELKGRLIFMNQLLTNSFGLFKTRNFLESLETDQTIVFDNFKQFGELMQQVFREIDGVAEYHLKFEANNKGYDTFEIVKRFK